MGRGRDGDAVLRTGYHPVAHKSPGRANLSDQDWLNYWANYYRKSKQLKKADEKSWKATREVWMRKSVQAKRIRCSECTRIVKIMVEKLRLRSQKVPIAREARKKVDREEVLEVANASGKFSLK